MTRRDTYIVIKLLEYVIFSVIVYRQMLTLFLFQGGNAIKAQIDKLQLPDMGDQDSLL